MAKFEDVVDGVSNETLPVTPTNDEMEGAIDVAEANVQSLQQQRDALSVDLSAVHAKEAEIAAWQAQITQANSEHSAALEAARAEHAAKQAEVQARQAELAALNADAEASVEARQAARDAVNAAREAAQAAQETVNQINASAPDFSDLNAQIAAAQGELPGLRDGAQAAYDAQIAALNTQIDAAQAEVETARDHYASWQAENTIQPVVEEEAPAVTLPETEAPEVGAPDVDAPEVGTPATGMPVGDTSRGSQGAPIRDTGDNLGIGDEDLGTGKEPETTQPVRGGSGHGAGNTGNNATQEALIANLLNTPVEDLTEEEVARLNRLTENPAILAEMDPDLLVQVQGKLDELNGTDVVAEQELPVVDPADIAIDETTTIDDLTPAEIAALQNATPEEIAELGLSDDLIAAVAAAELPTHGGFTPAIGWK